MMAVGRVGGWALALSLLVSAEVQAAPDSQALLRRIDALDRTVAGLRQIQDKGARSELFDARRWLELARLERKDGKLARCARLLQRVDDQLELVRRLAALAKLRARIDELKRRLHDARQRIQTNKRTLKEKKTYLDVLRTTR
jgi:chromosome segregation ATPase